MTEEAAGFASEQLPGGWKSRLPPAREHVCLNRSPARPPLQGSGSCQPRPEAAGASGVFAWEPRRCGGLRVGPVSGEPPVSIARGSALQTGGPDAEPGSPTAPGAGRLWPPRRRAGRPRGLPPWRTVAILSCPFRCHPSAHVCPRGSPCVLSALQKDPATSAPPGPPHVPLITSLKALSPSTVSFGSPGVRASAYDFWGNTM